MTSAISTSPRKSASIFRSIGRNLLVTFSVALFAIVLGGCGSPDAKFYDTGFNGQTVTVSRGKTLPVRMIINIQVGAKWEIVEFDKSVLDLRGEPRMLANIVTGGLPRIYSYEYKFHAVREGQTTLKMRMVKNDTGEVLENFEMTVVVTK